jgi:hypothetical protein
MAFSIERILFEHFTGTFRVVFEETTPEVSDRRYFSISLFQEYTDFPERNEQLILTDFELDDLCTLWQELRPQLITPIQETPAEDEE